MYLQFENGAQKKTLRKLRIFKIQNWGFFEGLESDKESDLGQNEGSEDAGDQVHAVVVQDHLPCTTFS